MKNVSRQAAKPQRRLGGDGFRFPQLRIPSRLGGFARGPHFSSLKSEIAFRNLHFPTAFDHVTAIEIKFSDKKEKSSPNSPVGSKRLEGTRERSDRPK